MYKILVVDNDIDVLTIVTLILTANDFEVEAISDWREVDAKVETFNPEIILLDVALGGEDGRNICRKLKQNYLNEHIQIILFSANHNLEITFGDYKADGFVAKPFDADHLVTKLKLQLTSVN